MKIKCLRTVQVFTVLSLLIHQSFAGCAEGKNGKVSNPNKEDVNQRRIQGKVSNPNKEDVNQRRIQYYNIQAAQQRIAKEAEAVEKQRAEDVKSTKEWLSDTKNAVVENVQKCEEKERKKQQKILEKKQKEEQKVQKEINTFWENIKRRIVHQDALDKRLVANLKQEIFVDQQNENIYENDLEIVEQNESVPSFAEQNQNVRSFAEQMREVAEMKKKKYEDDKTKERTAFLPYNLSVADDYNSVNQKYNQSIEDLNDIMSKKK